MKEITENIEQHPLPLFLPKDAKVLMLGSFPPPKTRWKMDFYYPNFQNDMWRIMGLIFFKNKDQLIDVEKRLFREKEIRSFLEEQGIAIYDAADKVRRLQNNAADKYLQIIQVTDLNKLLSQLPMCKHIITTGEKATQLILEYYQQSDQKIDIGSNIELNFKDGGTKLHRLPSSSRAYPLPLVRKAEIYQSCFSKIFNFEN